MSESQSFKDQYLGSWEPSSAAVFTREELSALSRVVDTDVLRGLACLEYDAKFDGARHKQEWWPNRLNAEEIHSLKERAHKIMDAESPSKETGKEG